MATEARQMGVAVHKTSTHGYNLVTLDDYIAKL